MSPDQELYDRLYDYSQNELKYDTYDALPRMDTSYPFVEMAGTLNNSDDLKNAYFGRVSQTINFWGNQDMRFDISEMMDKFLLNHIRTEHYVFTIDSKQKQMLPDSSVPNTILYHGILTLVFRYQETERTSK